MATRYDAEFTDTPVGVALRNLAWTRLAVAFRDARRVLELGCGTGEDAVRLAAAGIEVVATDASSAMIAIARDKARRAGCLERIEFHCLPMQDVVRDFAPRSFDGVLSNFGAVNCAPHLPALAADAARLLVPGGTLAWVLMGRRVPWEWLWYLLRGDPARAFRRYRRGGVAWRGLRVQYWPPDEARASLHGRFDAVRIAPLGVCIPPSYAAGWLNRSPVLLAALARLESLATRTGLCAGWADHYIVEARRTAAPAH